MKSVRLRYILKIFFLFIVICQILGCKKEVNNDIDENQISGIDEAQSAFIFLNKVREAPFSYSSEIGVDLSYVISLHHLKWNDTLAIVAQNKAKDMAERNYFGHIDPDGNGMNIKIHEAGYILPAQWINVRSKNNFESIGAGYKSGIDLIKGLIEDKDIDPPGHRNHLLGITPFWSNCYDIGIGYIKSKNSNYPTYSCVIIAKHNF